MAASAAAYFVVHFMFQLLSSCNSCVMWLLQSAQVHVKDVLTAAAAIAAAQAATGAEAAAASSPADFMGRIKVAPRFVMCSSHVTNHTSHIRHSMHIFTFYRIFCVILASEFPSSSTCRASKISTFSWTLRLASPTLPLLPCPPTLTLLPCPRRLSCPTCLPCPPRGRLSHAAAQCRRTRMRCLRCGLALRWCRNQVSTAGDTSCLP